MSGGKLFRMPLEKGRTRIGFRQRLASGGSIQLMDPERLIVSKPFKTMARMKLSILNTVQRKPDLHISIRNVWQQFTHIGLVVRQPVLGRYHLQCIVNHPVIQNRSVLIRIGSVPTQVPIRIGIGVYHYHRFQTNLLTRIGRREVTVGQLQILIEKYLVLAGDIEVRVGTLAATRHDALVQIYNLTVHQEHTFFPQEDL